MNNITQNTSGGLTEDLFAALKKASEAARSVGSRGFERRINEKIAEARVKQHELRLQAAGATACIDSLENHIWDLKEALAASKEEN